MIKVVTGVRRCGKSMLLELYIENLKSDGITDEQIIYKVDRYDIKGKMNLKSESKYYVII
ncbi:MAG: AAA family ATPase [Bacillota bacterium]|nr:AAA family ATPase [Bacillota bacterium]